MVEEQSKLYQFPEIFMAWDWDEAGQDNEDYEGKNDYIPSVDEL